MPTTLRSALLGLIKQWKLSPENAGCAAELYATLADPDVVDEDDAPRCVVTGCARQAKYETWMRNHDPMGCPTGMITLVTICEHHTDHPWLCRNQKKEHANSKEQQETKGA